MQKGNGMGFYSSDPAADSFRHPDERREALLDDHSLFANMMVNALAGNVNIIGDDGNAVPVEVTDIPNEVKATIEAKHYDNVGRECEVKTHVQPHYTCGCSFEDFS